MTVQDLVVIVAAVALSGALGWFFFGPRRARAAELVGDAQQVRVTVRGGYSPDLVRVRQGVPLRIVFDRQESGECMAGGLGPVGILANHWLQLAVITPVTLHSAWPIHRTGWLSLAHRSAEMISLITIGTTAAFAYSLVVTVAPGLVPRPCATSTSRPSAWSSR